MIARSSVLSESSTSRLRFCRNPDLRSISIFIENALLTYEPKPSRATPQRSREKNHETFYRRAARTRASLDHQQPAHELYDRAHVAGVAGIGRTRRKRC